MQDFFFPCSLDKLSPGVYLPQLHAFGEKKKKNGKKARLNEHFQLELKVNTPLELCPNQ